MNSTRPKALHRLGGSPLLAHVMAATRDISDELHVVVGYGSETVRAAFPDEAIHWHHQPKQVGTANAVACALSSIADECVVLVTYSDMPLLQTDSYRAVLNQLEHADFALLTAQLEQAHTCGRILRENNKIVGIVEDADASEQQKAISEVNVGVMASTASTMRKLLTAIDNHNSQQEYYLTDSVQLAVQQGLRVASAAPLAAWEVTGVNSPGELHAAERLYQQQQARRLMQQGVIVRDAKRLDIRGSVLVGRDVEIDVGVILEGCVRLDDGVRVGAHSIVRNSTIACRSTIQPYSIIDDARIGADCVIGPYARLRPTTIVGQRSRIGNFVEVKNSRIKENSKAGHLSYLGDSDIGANVNIGAGTITCNYDGQSKHRTSIGDDVFIGSSTQLIAPVTIHDGATIGAGSTITSDAPADKLSLSRSPQKTIDGWKRASKKGSAK